MSTKDARDICANGAQATIVAHRYPGGECEANAGEVFATQGNVIVAPSQVWQGGGYKPVHRAPRCVVEHLRLNRHAR